MRMKKIPKMMEMIKMMKLMKRVRKVTRTKPKTSPLLWPTSRRLPVKRVEKNGVA